MTRRVVCDNSVVIPAYFPETIQYRGSQFDLSRRARPLIDAIHDGIVNAYMPELLFIEFQKIAFEKVFDRRDISENDANLQRRHFMLLYELMQLIPAQRISDRVWELGSKHNLRAPDSWYLACAMEADAELWISHGQQDGFADTAKRVWQKTYLLTEKKPMG